MNNLNIAILQGTTRQKRKSIYVSNLILKVGNELEGVTAVLVDPVEFNFPFDGNDEENKDPRYIKITAEADGFFIVTPEYNHGFPGSLKRMLDSELKNYIHKPVAFAGVSSGNWGGIRAVESLVNVVRELGMAATFTDVQFPDVNKIFDESGNLLNNSYVNRIKRAFEELIWMAKVLKWGRENLPGKYH